MITFPFEYGGSNDNTKFFTFDIDSYFNIVAGGKTTDNIISPTSNLPILVFFHPDGMVKWSNLYTTPSNEFVSAVSFSPDFQYIGFAYG